MSNLCKTVVTLLLASYANADHRTDQIGLDTTYKPGAYFEYKTVIIPKDETKHRGGEDSADGSDSMLVVADGVGGWSELGIDPGYFSRRLTESAVENFHENHADITSAGTSLKHGCVASE